MTEYGVVKYARNGSFEFGVLAFYLWNTGSWRPCVWLHLPRDMKLVLFLWKPGYMVLR